MSEHTPTTEDMANAWKAWRAPFLERKSWFMPGELAEITRAEFNRWLSAHDAEIRGEST